MKSFRFDIFGGPNTQGWWWTLVRSHGRGKRSAEICGSKVWATEAECRDSLEAFRQAVAGAKVGRAKL